MAWLRPATRPSANRAVSDRDLARWGLQPGVYLEFLTWFHGGARVGSMEAGNILSVNVHTTGLTVRGLSCKRVILVFSFAGEEGRKDTKFKR